MIKGLSEKELTIVKSILEPYKNRYEFWGYGSRVKGNFRPLSDFDIYIKSSDEVLVSDIEALKSAFDNSDLPFVVNLAYDVNEDFYKLIKEDFINL